jgi:DNA/RNA-binding protein KIN17
MPRAEAGSVKDLSNRMKMKGLQRLRWYCEVCKKQCRDANGFKQHTMSESHVRTMQLIGQEGLGKVVQGYSNEFQHDFLQLLRTSHGEKQVNANHFYQQYIAKKDHIHMNATKWKSLTEFVAYLGREGICRVEDNEKGLHIAWIDRSPEALRRQDAVRRKERLQEGDQRLADEMLRQQIERAEQEAEAKKQDEPTEEEKSLQRLEDGTVEKIEIKPVKMSLGGGLARPKATNVFAKKKRKREEGGEEIPTKRVDTL